MSKQRMISRTYGDKDYKGFILLKDRNTGVVTKHYISAVDRIPLTDKVRVYVRNKNGDTALEYKMGSSKKADIGIKTWVKERKRKKMRVDSNLPKSCYGFLRRKRSSRTR